MARISYKRPFGVLSVSSKSVNSKSRNHAHLTSEAHVQCFLKRTLLLSIVTLPYLIIPPAKLRDSSVCFSRRPGSKTIVRGGVHRTHLETLMRLILPHRLRSSSF